MNNPWDKFLNDYLYPILSFFALLVFLSGQAKAQVPLGSGVHESQSLALMEALHDCRLTGTYKTMECATAVLRTANSEYRIMPVTVGTEQTFRLHIAYQPGDVLVCIFHTHPGRDANADSFSDLDVRVAKKLSVPSYIFVLRLGEMRVYYPTHRALAANNVSNPGRLAP